MSANLRSGPSRQPSIASTASGFGVGRGSPVSSGSGSGGNGASGGGGGGGGSSSVGVSSLSNPSQRFRKLVWDATVPIAVTIEGGDLTGYGASVDRSIETYYVRAPRISYLPLLLQEVRQNLLSIMLDSGTLAKIKEEEYWFTYEGAPLRWHWPIGLLYDYHTANAAPSVHRTGSNVHSLTQAMRRLSTAPSSATVTSDSYFSPPQQQTDSAFVNAYVPPAPPVPWRLTLRIGSAPLEKLHSAPGLSNCRASFMSMVKEADFVRFGSTKRVVNLRRTEQDALWEGVESHDFDMYWSVASKLVPGLQSPSATTTDEGTAGSLSPSRATSFSSAAAQPDGSSVDRFGTASSQLTAKPSLMQQFNESQTSLHSAAPSESNISVAESMATGKTTIGQSSTPIGGGGATVQGGYRSLPMRFHLATGAPVVQEPVAPYTDDGRPVTLHAVLSALFPLLFPPTPTFAPSSNAAPPAPLAYAIIQGVRIPLEAEIPWIGSVLPSADGWVAVCIHLLAEGENII